MRSRLAFVALASLVAAAASLPAQLRLRTVTDASGHVQIELLLLSLGAK